MRKLQISSILFLVFITVIGFFACGKKEMLRAKEIPEAVKSYIYAYTAGVISKSDPVRVRFAGASVTADKVGTDADGILSFQPSVSGNAIWEDDHTVRFDPEDGWESGTAYIAKVSLCEVFNNLPEAAKSFEFDFLVREQNLTVEVFGIEPEDASNLQKQVLKGTSLVNDKVKNEDLEKVLSAAQGGKDLPLAERQPRLGQFTTQSVLALSDQVMQQEEQVAGRQGLQRARRVRRKSVRTLARHLN